MYIVKIIGIIFLVLGMVFAITTIIMRTSFSKKKKLYTYKVMATVLEIKEKVIYKPLDVTQKYYTYFNRYQYKVNDNVYEEWSNTGCMPGRFAVGDIVELHCNYNNPKQFYVEKENNKVINNVFAFTSIILLSLSAVLLYISSNF